MNEDFNSKHDVSQISMYHKSVQDSLIYLPLSEIPTSIVDNIRKELKESVDLGDKVFIQDLKTEQFQYLPDNYKYVVTVERSNKFNIFDSKGFNVIKSKQDTELRKVYQLLVDYLTYKKLRTMEVSYTLGDFMAALCLSANNLTYIYAVQDYISRKILNFYETECEASYAYRDRTYNDQFKVLKIYNPFPINY